MYAIISKGNLKRISYRRYKTGMPLNPGELIVNYECTANTIEDNGTLRELTPAELQAEQDAENTAGARIDRAFPGNDTGQVIIGAFLELANRVKELEKPGSQPYTRAQIKQWLQDKLP